MEGGHKSSSVVVRGFPEANNDYHELLTMFDYLHCRCEITHHFRMSRIIRKNKKSSGRPIKVQLRPPGDVEVDRFTQREVFKR